MIILRKQQNNFSNLFINKLSNKLDKLGLEDDYDISDNIPSDTISIVPNLTGGLRINIPVKDEYCQYEIDDFIRRNFSHTRTYTNLDRNIYTMKVSGMLNEVQLTKLIKYIIEELEQHCTIIGE